MTDPLRTLSAALASIGIAVHEPSEAGLALPAEVLAARMRERERAVAMRNASVKVNGYDYRPRAEDIIDGSGGKL